MKNRKQNKFLLNVLLIFLLLICTANNSVTKKFVPVKWSFIANKLNDCEYELLFQGQIDKNWHLYGLKSYGKNGPMPTSFSFYTNQDYTLTGHISQSECIKEFEPLWDFKVQFFKHQVEFKQKIKIRRNRTTSIKGQIEFMVGNGNQCLPPYRVDFKFEVSGTDACLCRRSISTTNCSCDSTSNTHLPKTVIIQARRKDSLTVDSINGVVQKKTLPEAEMETEETRSWWLFFFAGFLNGSATLLTLS